MPKGSSIFCISDLTFNTSGTNVRCQMSPCGHVLAQSEYGVEVYIARKSDCGYHYHACLRFSILSLSRPLCLKFGL